MNNDELCSCGRIGKYLVGDPPVLSCNKYAKCSSKIVELNVTDNVLCVCTPDSGKYFYEYKDSRLPVFLNDLSIRELEDILNHRKYINSKFLFFNASYEFLLEKETGDYLFEIFGNTSRYIPARIYGPVESCYPEEGGELEDYYVNLKSLIIDEQETIQSLNWQKIMKIENDFCDYIENNENVKSNIQEKLYELAWSKE